MKLGTLWVTGDTEADALTNSDPLALLVAMLLDQQIPIEWAFAGPARLRARLAELDPPVAFSAQAIAELDPESLVVVACEKPAIHRFPAVMARRIHDLCVHVDREFGGDPSRIWQRRRAAEAVRDRLLKVPGYGEEKTRILIAVLGKRFGIRPAGWDLVAAPFADSQPRSVADMGSEGDRAAVREWRAARKAEGKTKFD